MEAQLARINARLKLEKVKVTIQVKGNTFYFRGTFPQKDDPDAAWSQQRVSTGIPAYRENLKQVENLARLVSEELRSKSFSWETWRGGETEEQSAPVLPKGQTKKAPETAAQLIARFEEYRWQTRERTPQAEYTWKNDYYLFYKEMVLDKPFSIEQVRAVMLRYENYPRQRNRSYTRFKALAKFAQMDLQEFEHQLKGLRGEYQIGMDTGIKRDLPTDEQILQLRSQITNEVTLWCFSALAIWGLRPHELWLVDFEGLTPESDGIITVLPEQNGVIGKGTRRRKRTVVPLLPKWYQQWRMWEYKIPNSNAPTARLRGQLIVQNFNRHGLKGLLPYDLRHAWAVRALYEDIPIARAALCMGHSVVVHERTYLYWIGEEENRKQLARLISSSES